MKKKFAVTVGILILIFAMTPYFAFANHNPIKTNVFDPLSSLFALNGPLVVCTGVPSTTGITTLPGCNNLCDLVAQIANIIYFMIAVVLWIIAPILILVGGIMIMLTGASPEMISRGKKTITGAIWGIVIVLCAWLIVFSFVSALGNLSKYIGGFGGSGGQAACSL